MKTKLDYYRIFYETARHSSFSTAAKKLYISQSAISQCIHQLEEDLKTQLFVRSRKGVSLTQEGLILYSKVESAMQFLEQGETLLNRLHYLESGSLIIAAGDTITTNYLLPYLEQFHEKYPDIRIEMKNSYSEEMLKSVKEGHAELAFVNMPAEDDELEIIPCFEIHDIFVCGSEKETKESYSWQQMSREPLIMLEENSSSRRFVNSKFKEKRLTLTPQIELAVHDLLVRFASIHLGVSCVIEEFSKDSLKSGKIKKMNLIPPLPSRHIGYAYLKHNPLSLAAREFLKLINEG